MCDPHTQTCRDQDLYGNQFVQGLYVDQAGDPIDTSACGSDDSTHGEVVEDYLGSVCPEGGVAVDPTTGQVTMDQGVCADPAAMAPDHPESCAALCEMVETDNRWDIVLDDVGYPQTVFADDDAAMGGGGSGGVVTAPSPNSCNVYGATDVDGNLHDMSDERVLTHELMGHGRLGNRGEHPDQDVTPRGQGGHEPIIDQVNVYGQEQGWVERGTWRDPMCGESYVADESVANAPAEFSPYLEECEDYREDNSMTLDSRVPESTPPTVLTP